jgi:charged multivesicular body protein 7
VDKDATEDIREITVVDRGILELKDAVENMHAQIDNIQQRMDE